MTKSIPSQLLVVGLSLAILLLVGAVITFGFIASQGDEPILQIGLQATPTIEPVRSYLQTATFVVPETRPTGIFDAGIDFSHEGFRMTNAWQQKVNGYWANVEVGTRSAEPKQGVVFSSWEFPNAAIAHFYETPARAGNLTIVAERNYRLEIQAENGMTFYFDVPSQSFVATLDEIALTITPPPTHTPTPIWVLPCLGAGYPGFSSNCITATMPPYPR